MTTTFKSISVPQVKFDAFTGEIAFGQRPIVRPRDRIAASEIKSFLKASGSNSGERWITINSDNEGGGTHVKINGDGKIVAGPAGLAARGITHLSDFGKKDGGDKKEGEKGAEKKPSKGEATKQPHEMTGEELMKHRDSARRGDVPKLEGAHQIRRDAFVEYRRLSAAESIGRDARPDRSFDYESLRKHKTAVETALQTGKPVPAEVLADYPDLVKPTNQPPATQAGGGSGKEPLNVNDAASRLHQGTVEHSGHSVRVISTTSNMHQIAHKGPGDSEFSTLGKVYSDRSMAQDAAANYLDSKTSDKPKTFADRYKEKLTEKGHELDARNQALADHLNERGANVTANDINSRFSNHHVGSLGGHSIDDNVRNVLEHSISTDYSEPMSISSGPRMMGVSLEKQNELVEKDRGKHLETADKWEEDAKIMDAVGSHDHAQKLRQNAVIARSKVERNRKEFERAAEVESAEAKRQSDAESAKQEAKKKEREFSTGKNAGESYTPKQLANELKDSRWGFADMLAKTGIYTNGKIAIKPPEKTTQQILGHFNGNIPEGRHPAIGPMMEAAESNRMPAMRVLGERTLSREEHLTPTELRKGKTPKTTYTHESLLSDDEGNHSLVDSRNLRTIQKMYPKATFHSSDDNSSAIVVKNDGKVVGLLMPFSKHDRDEERRFGDNAFVANHVSKITGASKPVRKSMTGAGLI